MNRFKEIVQISGRCDRTQNLEHGRVDIFSRFFLSDIQKMGMNRRLSLILHQGGIGLDPLIHACFVTNPVLLNRRNRDTGHPFPEIIKKQGSVLGVEYFPELARSELLKFRRGIPGNFCHGRTGEHEAHGIISGNDQALQGLFHQLTVLVLIFLQTVFFFNQIMFQQLGIELHQAHDKGNLHQ